MNCLTVSHVHLIGLPTSLSSALSLMFRSQVGKLVIWLWLRMRQLEVDDRNILTSEAMCLILFPDRSILIMKSGIVSRESICQTTVTICPIKCLSRKNKCVCINRRKVIIVQLLIPDWSWYWGRLCCLEDYPVSLSNLCQNNPPSTVKVSY